MMCMYILYTSSPEISLYTSNTEAYKFFIPLIIVCIQNITYTVYLLCVIYNIE